MSEKAKVAIAAVLARIQSDPRVAYYFDPITDCREKLVAAHCELNSIDEATFKAQFDPKVKYEAPPREEEESAPQFIEVPPVGLPQIKHIFEAFYTGNEAEAMRLTKEYVQTATGRVLPV
ncbi:hypothetical protein [Paraburkholderia elongata]|uniref:hypothetical protein n=1 Tax=Paraburkholderia elongata TaxID=2675747 RepID=UPI001C130D59|nr:hypothetical protein [Paraburkholderia elongata]